MLSKIGLAFNRVLFLCERDGLEHHHHWTGNPAPSRRYFLSTFSRISVNRRRIQGLFSWQMYS
jgi:hypothetical protein